MEYMFVCRVVLIWILYTGTLAKVSYPRLMDVDQFVEDMKETINTVEQTHINLFNHDDQLTLGSDTVNDSIQLGSSPLKPTGILTIHDEEYLIIDHNKGPQSFSLLMNFQADGTSLVKILRENSLFWGDNGRCNYGQIYDPNTGFCRDVFCSTGYMFTADGCVKVKNETKYEPVIRQDEIKIEIEVLHRLCLYKTNFNETTECTHPKITSSRLFLNDFKIQLANALSVSAARLDDMKIKSNIVINEVVDDIYTVTSEKLEISLVLRDNKKFENDKTESVSLYFLIVSMTMKPKYLKVLNHQMVIVKVTEEKDSSFKENWCKAEGDSTIFYNSKHNLKILAEFNEQDKPAYYVYILETQTLYPTGDFNLSIIYISKEANTTDFTLEKKVDPPFIYWDINNNNITENTDTSDNIITLKDVTDIILENSQKTQSEVLINVCNHKPKIKEACYRHETVRVGLCELIPMKNRSYCSKIIDECYSSNQYEYDEYKPTEFIRVCKYEMTENHSLITYKEKILSKIDTTNILSVLAGWLSSVSLMISIIFMVITLVTYALFKKLRNIPGWLVINLTIALCLAQFFFLLGSLIKNLPLGCFIVAIITHYSFLASFFWMNVIAFDLYRNFRIKSSHVLLLMVQVKERIPIYAIFGWLAPLVLIITCILFDIFFNSLGSFRPCYAGYLDGCIKYNTIDLMNTNYTNTTYYSNRFALDNQTEAIDTCSSKTNNIYHIALLSRSCWISNGNANLIFFGLPIALIIIMNAVLLILTIYNIRKAKSIQNKSDMRRISRKKMPGDQDVKFYIQMAFLLGFTWIIGFFLTTFSSDHIIIMQILAYIFIFLNASIGVFIFFVFIFKKETLELYKKLFKHLSTKLPFLNSSSGEKNKSRAVSHQESSCSNSSNNTETTNNSIKSFSSVENTSSFHKVNRFSNLSLPKTNNELNLSDIAFIEEEQE